MKHKKREVKPFIMGCITTVVIGGLIFSCIKVLSGKKNALHDKSETIDGITYTISYERDNGIKCDAYKDIRLKRGSYFITNDGTLYITSDKKYSTTNQNCKVYDDNIKIRSVIDGVLVAIDKTKYIVENNENNEITFKKDNNVLLNSYLLEEDIKYAIKDDGEYYEEDGSRLYTYYVLKNDGKLYRMVFVVKYNPSTSKYTYTLEKNELALEFEGEKITDFYISNNPNSGYIITDKTIYLQEVKNKECLEYEDIKCNYEFIKNNYLTKYLNNILSFDYSERSYLYINTLDGKHIEITMTRE